MKYINQQKWALLERADVRARVTKHLESVAKVPSGCILWAKITDNKGYGRLRIYLDGKAVFFPAHRAAWILAHGPIADGLVIDHLCRTRHCVNLEHLELVTHRVNALRGVSFSAVNSIKTHCPKGHPLEGGNLIIRRKPSYERICRICRNRYFAGLMARKRDAAR